MQHYIYITVNLLQLDVFVLVVHEKALSTKMEWLGIKVQCQGSTF